MALQTGPSIFYTQIQCQVGDLSQNDKTEPMTARQLHTLDQIL